MTNDRMTNDTMTNDLMTKKNDKTKPKTKRPAVVAGDRC